MTIDDYSVLIICMRAVACNGLEKFIRNQHTKWSVLVVFIGKIMAQQKLIRMANKTGMEY